MRLRDKLRILIHVYESESYTILTAGGPLVLGGAQASEAGLGRCGEGGPGKTAINSDHLSMCSMEILFHAQARTPSAISRLSNISS